MRHTPLFIYLDTPSFYVGRSEPAHYLQWFFLIFKVAKVVIIIHQDDLAKFGYQLNMKFKKLKHPSIFLATYFEPV